MDAKHVVAVMALAAVLLVSATVLAPSETDAGDGAVYGSVSSPYGGMIAGYDGLEDGATYHMVPGSSITIFYGTLGLYDVETDLEGTGLTKDDSEGFLDGTIDETIELTIGEKTFTLEVGPMVYGDLAIYGAEITSDPVEYRVGNTMTAAVQLREVGFWGSIFDPTDFKVNRDEFDPSDYGFRVYFESRDVGDSSYIFAFFEGTAEVACDSRIRIDDSQTGDTYYIPIIIHGQYTIRFDANGGSCAVSEWTGYSDQAFVLPEASMVGHKFLGWFTEKENGVEAGKANETYTPEMDVTLYAHYEPIPATIIVEDQHYQVNSGQPIQHLIEYQLSDGADAVGATFEIVANTADNGSYVGLDSISHLFSFRTTEQGTFLVGTLTDVMPTRGDGYVITIKISKDGYEPAYQHVFITVPIFVYEPLTATIEVGEKYGSTLEVEPEDGSYISSLTILDEDRQPVTSGVTPTTSGLSFSVIFDTEGVYDVIVHIENRYCNPTTKTFTLNVVGTEMFDHDPVIEGIIVAKHPTLNGGYYFTADGANYYNTIEWVFGDDGSEFTGTDNIVHRFTSPGYYDITCTVRNITTGKSASFTLEDFNPSMDTDRSQIVVNTEYAVLLMIPSENAELVVEPNQSWLDMEMGENDDGYYARVFGTCTNSNLDGTTITITVNVDGELFDTWEATIHNPPDLSDDDLDIQINGYVVTITNNGENASTTTLYIDWNGDGEDDARVPNQTYVTHDYSEDFGAGTYTILIKMTCLGTMGSQTFTNVVIPSNSTGGYLLYFIANGGIGQMAAQNGTSMKLPDCTFERDGWKFVEWNTKADGTGDSYDPGDLFEWNQQTYIYAIWTVDNGTPEPGDDGNMQTIMLIAIVVLVAVVLILLIRR